MKAKELMKPRFEVIANYPGSHLAIGKVIDFDYGKTEYDSPNNFENYPAIFRPLNWWEYRTVEEMPKRVICKAIPDDTEIIEIEEWDMKLLVGWRDKKNRKCASLLSFNPKYGYFPID